LRQGGMRPLRMCNWGPCWVKGALARCTGASGMELLLLSRYGQQALPQKGACCKMGPSRFTGPGVIDCPILKTTATRQQYNCLLGD